MKLIECHIAGFGPFKDCKLSFDDGLNVILQPNGWGKTSLSAYVKAMLYGFERKRVRDVSENERLRYKPWSGGNTAALLTSSSMAASIAFFASSAQPVQATP